MKKIIILFILFTSVKAFSQLGFFSLGYILPLAGSLPQYYIENHGGILNKNSYESQSAFEIGFLVQPAYNFILHEYAILGLGMDLGYYRDAYRFINYEDRQKYTHIFDSLNIGGYIEGLFSNIFMIGFGGGVKVPLGGSYRYDYIIESLNYSRLKQRFDDIVIPYVKFLIGVKSFPAISGFSLSFYFNYDFPVIKDIRVSPDSVKFSSIDLGVQIGIYISNLGY
ncbi:hypothetical protein [Brachyspira sp.]|uniref:hypothetical protein n=1 Tax=Brachyspira sp. TaxID=1977261 RepID=UPI00262E837F|nr:hypothetical protein [Brachyspira sp.]